MSGAWRDGILFLSRMLGNGLDLVVSAALRALSWVLGLLDTIYAHVAVRRKTAGLFEDGYGDLAEELRLQTFIRGKVPALAATSVHVIVYINIGIPVMCCLCPSKGKASDLAAVFTCSTQP